MRRFAHMAWAQTKVVAVAAFLVILTLAAMSCGPSARQRAVRGTLTAVNTARDAFTAWDAKAQHDIVEQSTSLEEGQAKLAVHRAARDRLVAAFEAAYRSLAIAAADPTDDRVILATAAATALWSAYQAVVGVPPPAGGKE